MLAQGTGANEGPALPLFWICLLTQACLISWEALAGSLPAEARMPLLPGYVVLGTPEGRGRAGHGTSGHGTSCHSWESRKQLRDLATGKLALSWRDSGYRARLYLGMDSALPLGKSERSIRMPGWKH